MTLIDWAWNRQEPALKVLDTVSENTLKELSVVTSATTNPDLRRQNGHILNTPFVFHLPLSR